jgi:signal transduction histidine kinase/ligand-binding sensor domain-containing protein/CheY-like chemotaxis protein
MNRIYPLILFFLSLFSGLQAQEKQVLFSNISKTNGLSHNQIRVFLKDKKGFIWIGTNEGLCRFDGYSIKVYKNNPEDSVSIRDNKINNLFEDNVGNIWISAGDFLEVFNPETETFQHQQALFNNRIPVPENSAWWHVYDINQDIIYANSHSGIYKYLVNQDSVINVKLPYALTASKKISWMLTDKYGNIWISCTNAVLYKIDYYSHNITDSLVLTNKSDNSYRFYIDSDNDMWIYDKNNTSGAIYYSSKKRELKYFTKESDCCRLNNNAVTACIEDDEKNIWLATDHGGINIVNKTDLSVKYITNNPFNERSLCDNSITTLYKDYHGFIWIGSFKRGLSYYHKNLYNFSLFKIRIENIKVPDVNDVDNFAEDRKGNIWIGTNGGGLIYFNRQNNSFRQYTENPGDLSSLSSNIIVGLYMDKKERLWIGTYYGGLNLFDGKRFYHFRSNPSDPTTISDDRIWDICEDRNGKLWIATLLGGVNVFDPVTRKVIKQFKWETENSIRTNVVFSIIEDREGLLWFATTEGLRSYNQTNGKFEYYTHTDDSESLSKNYVYDVFEDSRGFIWAATSDGLNLFNKATRTFKIFRQADGLPSNNILTITEDNYQNLWISTSNGISNVIITKDPQSKSLTYNFRNFDVRDGLQGNEFNEKAVYKTSKGEIIFGGPNGFNLFDPRFISTKNIDTETVFTDFQLFNKSITNKDVINKRKILKKQISYTDEITLLYRENVFSIEFSNLNFFHPERRKYKYILENFNKDWFICGSNSRKITYTNLNPGKYIFKVLATNSDGSWSNKETKLTINIKPPLWKTTYFRIFLIIVIIGSGIGLYYYRLYNLDKQKHLLEKKIKERTKELSEVNVLLEERQEEISVQKEELENHRNNLERLVNERTIELEKAINRAKESDRLKTNFLANMSHEIRTPMNAIVGFAALLRNQEGLSPESKEFVDIINQNCESLLVLINDIIDVSKIEADQLNIVVSKFSVNSILCELESYYKFNNGKGLDINLVHNSKYPTLILNNDPFRFRQVISNLISNAVKFTDKGFIKFGYEILNDKVRFFVKDSGIGINEKDFIKIFDHFHKVEDSGEKFFRGAGLGLSICKKLVSLMGGEIWLESEYGKGSTFYFTLPYEFMPLTPAKETEEKSKDALFNNLTVLIAEDEPINYYLIERILKPTNAELIWAKNGKEALDRLKLITNQQNLIVLMDIRMPVMDGIDALKQIREINRKIPVIALTAYAYETDRFEILKHRFDGYLAKPLKPETLIEIIKSFHKNL